MTQVQRIARLAAAAVVLGLASKAGAQTGTMPSDAWTWRATVYGWFPSINGTSNFKGLPGSDQNRR
jgi:hypothetical protein